MKANSRFRFAIRNPRSAIRNHCLLCILAIPLSAGQADGQSEAVKAAMQPFVESGEVSGIVTFVGNKEGVLDVQVLGVADLDHKVPMKRDTIFR
ncbi:MAG TPA: hypothetical protein VGX78_01620, partial [Pirellulales bacterium]|nr:hypothetical protein [Pirellulales bacterium]